MRSWLVGLMAFMPFLSLVADGSNEVMISPTAPSQIESADQEDGDSLMEGISVEPTSESEGMGLGPDSLEP
jgi:hypothetical protein